MQGNFNVMTVESAEGTQTISQHNLSLINMATREKHEVPACIASKELA